MKEEHIEHFKFKICEESVSLSLYAFVAFWTFSHVNSLIYLNISVNKIQFILCKKFLFIDINV